MRSCSSGCLVGGRKSLHVEGHFFIQVSVWWLVETHNRVVDHLIIRLRSGTTRAWYKSLLMRQLYCVVKVLCSYETFGVNRGLACAKFR